MRSRVGLWGAFGVAAALTGAMACGDDPTPPKASGSTGTGGADGGGGASTGGGGGAASDAPGLCKDCECTPQDEACYVEGKDGYGAQCQAQRKQPRDEVNDHLMFRQTWGHTTMPPQPQLVYDLLQARAQLPDPGCGTPNGSSGFMQLTDMHGEPAGEDDDFTVTGFAQYVTADEVAGIKKDGICMVAGEYNDPNFALTAAEVGAGKPNGPAPMAQPWDVQPAVSRRRGTDFDICDIYGAGSFKDVDGTTKSCTGDPSLRDPNAAEGFTYLDTETGYSHSYQPITYAVIYDSADVVLVIPIHEVEAIVHAEPDGSCIGRHRAEALSAADGCSSGDPDDPNWGCTQSDADHTCDPGQGGFYTRGYYLITEVEQAFSTALSQTNCVNFIGQQKAVADGWAVQSAAGGLGCRDSDLWDPSLPNDEGLPMGDWCSDTNAPATATCHDAFRSENYSTQQAFPIKQNAAGDFPELCPLMP